MPTICEDPLIQARRDLRDKSGKTLLEICKEALNTDPLFPQTHNGLLSIEERGTENYWQLLALATVYRITLKRAARVFAPDRRMEHLPPL